MELSNTRYALAGLALVPLTVGLVGVSLLPAYTTLAVPAPVAAAAGAGAVAAAYQWYRLTSVYLDESGIRTDL
jgi:hypothetical protein